MPKVGEIFKEALKSKAAKIEDLKQDFDRLEKLIRDKQISKAELEHQIKANEVSPGVLAVAVRSVSSLREGIDDDLKEATKISDKVERLGDSDTANNMRDKLETLGSPERAQVLKTTVRL